MKESSNSSKILYQPSLASSIRQYTDLKRYKSRRTNELLTSSRTLNHVHAIYLGTPTT